MAGRGVTRGFDPPPTCDEGSVPVLTHIPTDHGIGITIADVRRQVGMGIGAADALGASTRRRPYRARGALAGYTVQMRRDSDNPHAIIVHRASRNLHREQLSYGWYRGSVPSTPRPFAALTRAPLSRGEFCGFFVVSSSRKSTPKSLADLDIFFTTSALPNSPLERGGPGTKLFRGNVL